MDAALDAVGQKVRSSPTRSVGPRNTIDVRGYRSRRFHVQSFAHVFQVLIKLYDQKYESKHVEVALEYVLGWLNSRRWLSPTVCFVVVRIRT